MSLPRRPGKGLRRAAGWALVVALHAVLWWGLGLVTKTTERPATPQSSALLWLLREPLAAPVPVTEVPAPQTATRAPPPRNAELPVLRAPSPPEPGVAQAITVPGLQAQRADEPASSPSAPDTGRLIDSAATRRAIREAARATTLAERAAQASDEPARLGSTQRFGREVEKAAIGDCLKGEFAGAGAGLLSLPFLLAAELRGQCRK